MAGVGWYGGWYGWGGMIWGMIWLRWDVWAHTSHPIHIIPLGWDVWAHTSHPSHIIPHIIPPQPYHPPYHPTPAISSHHLIFFTLIPQALNVKEWYYILNILARQNRLRNLIMQQDQILFTNILTIARKEQRQNLNGGHIIWVCWVISLNFRQCIHWQSLPWAQTQSFVWQKPQEISL